jgi:hypothetical protein
MALYHQFQPLVLHCSWITVGFILVSSIEGDFAHELIAVFLIKKTPAKTLQTKQITDKRT